DLVSLYFTSVGRNSKLLLNVPPTRDGLLHETDVARLAGMHERLSQLFAHDVAAGRSLRRQTTGDGAGGWELDLGRVAPISIVDLREDISHGQVVARYTVEGRGDSGDWQTISQGTTIGYKKLDRVSPVSVRYVRLRIDDAHAVRLRLF